MSEYEATRRDLVHRGVLLGGLSVAAAGVPTLLGASRALAQGGGDERVLEGAIALEQNAVLTYATVAKSGGLRSDLRATAERFGSHEQAHVDALVGMLEQLGGTPPPRPTRPAQVPGLDRAVAGGQRAILEFAVALEETAVAAYHEAARRLTDGKVLQTAAAIMGDEGQHLVVLRQALGRNPVPHAFETGRAG